MGDIFGFQNGFLTPGSDSRMTDLPFKTSKGYPDFPVFEGFWKLDKGVAHPFFPSGKPEKKDKISPKEQVDGKVKQVEPVLGPKAQPIQFLQLLRSRTTACLKTSLLCF